MALKIRLRQQGRNNRPFYRVVVADVRFPRDGKYVESVGWYNPFETEIDKLLHLDTERLQYWVGQGAQVTESVEALIAKGAPSILREWNEKTLANRTKLAAKRRQLRKKS